MNPNIYFLLSWAKSKTKICFKNVIEILPNYIQHGLGESTVVIQEDGKGKNKRLQLDITAGAASAATYTA